MSSAVQFVLVDLWQQLNVIGQKDEERENGNDDAKIFKSLTVCLLNHLMNWSYKERSLLEMRIWATEMEVKNWTY